jgi:chemotaxis methyl-accepting protein methylase
LLGGDLLLESSSKQGSRFVSLGEMHLIFCRNVLIYFGADRIFRQRSAA